MELIASEEVTRVSEVRVRKEWRQLWQDAEKAASFDDWAHIMLHITAIPRISRLVGPDNSRWVKHSPEPTVRIQLGDIPRFHKDVVTYLRGLMEQIESQRQPALFIGEGTTLLFSMESVNGLTSLVIQRPFLI